MKTRAMVVFVLLAGIGSSLSACGDKFLVAGRGTRFRRAAVPRASASILVYADPASNLTPSRSSLPIEATLRKAGYLTTVVETSDALDSALRQGRWDLLLVDAAQSETVSTRLRQDAAPLLLPVLSNPTGAEWKLAKKQFPALVKTTAKQNAFLESIDEALSVRPKSTGKITS